MFKEDKKKKHGKLIKCNCCKKKMIVEEEVECGNVIEEFNMKILYCECGNQIIIK